MPVFRTAYIYVRNIYAGFLCETDEGYTFTYDTDYLNSPGATAVSLTLPLQSEPYLSKTLFSLSELNSFDTDLWRRGITGFGNNPKMLASEIQQLSRFILKVA